MLGGIWEIIFAGIADIAVSSSLNSSVGRATVGQPDGEGNRNVALRILHVLLHLRMHNGRLAFCSDTERKAGGRS